MSKIARFVLFLSLGIAVGPTIANSQEAGEQREPENHAITIERLMRYHDSGEYDREIREVANSAREFLRARVPGPLDKGAKLAVVFDIDETSLSNWDVMAACGFCLYTTQLQLYKDGLFSVAHDPAIVPVRELFDFAIERGFAVFFVTGRPKSQHDLTVANLQEAGYSGWTDDIYMQPDVEQGKAKSPARMFKPQNRHDIERKGYRIVLNIGDQASDLAGCCAEKTFKLPNPFYLVP
jgi:predicted secreted acid phosphatase